MYKVAFYIDNYRVANVDCTGIEDGNPGIGGTEYLFYFTVYNLQAQSSLDMSFVLLTSYDARLPEMKYDVVGSKEKAIAYCMEKQYDILVIKYEESDYSSDTLLSHENIMPLKIVVWAHNVIPNHILNRMEHLVSVIVNVGREQLDLYRDHNMFYKSTFIYNSLPIKSLDYYQKNSIQFEERGHEVTYLGSLVPVKGFHILAKVWKDILKAVPDAHLNVIGSGKVYDSEAKLGPYGIAEENYERKFMPYLIDANGEILNSVTFWGKLGKEKDEILGRTKVGVPNPAGTSETFCLSAVEMALYGARIVSMRYVGLIDTVPQEVGQLVKDGSELSKAIIEELNRCKNSSAKSYDLIFCNFSVNNIIYNWISLFYELMKKNKINYSKELYNPWYNLKYIREINRRVKKIVPFGRILPTVDFYIICASGMFGRKLTNRLIKY